MIRMYFNVKFESEFEFEFGIGFEFSIEFNFKLSFEFDPTCKFNGKHPGNPSKISSSSLSSNLCLNLTLS